MRHAGQPGFDSLHFYPGYLLQSGGHHIAEFGRHAGINVGEDDVKSINPGPILAGDGHRKRKGGIGWLGEISEIEDILQPDFLGGLEALHDSHLSTLTVNQRAPRPQ